MNNTKRKGVYSSFSAFEKHFFPKSYKRKMRDIEIKEKGFGGVLADDFIKIIRKQIKNIVVK